MPHVELPQAEFKVVMLGDTFTGKTSLVLRFAEGYYRESGRDATVGAFFITKRITVHGITCKIQIWDTAGQEQFNQLAPMYYKNAAAAIICYDVTSPKSFETLKYWIDELQQNVPAGSIVLAMCATKGDLAAHPDTTEAEELAQKTGAMFLTTSAKENNNVTLLFEKVAERVLQFQKQHSTEGGAPIPVTLATTAVETTAHSAPNMNASSTEARIHPSSPGRNQVAPLEGTHKPMLVEEDGVVDPAESKDSKSVEDKARCDAANILMCGDGDRGGIGCNVM